MGHHVHVSPYLIIFFYLKSGYLVSLFLQISCYVFLISRMQRGL
jgi:hypothetical protein